MSRRPRVPESRQLAPRVKAQVARLLSSPAAGALISVACGDRIRNAGVVIDTSHPAFTDTVRAQLAFGIYESAEIRFIRRYLTGFTRVLELGSSLGVTASHIIDVAAPGAEVVCVEANPELLNALRTTLAAAAARTGAKVTAVHGAVPADLRPPSSGVLLKLGTSHLGSRVDSVTTDDGARRLRVPAVDPYELVRGWTGYALVCDIEGAEAALICPGRPVLTRASRLVIELHQSSYRGARVTVAELRETLLNMGFLLVAERGRVLVLDGPVAATADRPLAGSRE